MSGGQERMGGRGGHDAAIFSREEDHLDRWPFAHEIYGVATTGPKEWSVWIGVYGEWGSGKTSVLNMASRMAEEDGHVVVWFNPWEHGSRESLWRAFVTAVYTELQEKLGPVRGAYRARAKALASQGKKIITSIAKCANEHAGTAAEEGLDLVKRFVALGPSDLKEIPAILGDKRVIVLIDDLDRTAPELVPEILFAIKELMNVPGFSFICAFDPEVVSHVLGRYHPGFGEGLKFLDKIIDYPRWLPIPSWDGLTKLAVAETSRLCRFVPPSDLKEAVGLLPPNPRAVRQFIRLVSLMRPQIERHNDDELIWPIILTAAVVKVRFPRLALGLLRSGKFWAKVASEWEGNEQQAREKVRGLIDKHISEVVKVFGGSVSAQERACIRDSLLALAPHVELWSGVGSETMAHQMRVAEEPRAVTMKEFGEFWNEFRRMPSAVCAKTWIERQSDKVVRSEKDVYRDLLAAAVRHRDAIFGQMSHALHATDLPDLRKEADELLGLFERLVLEMGHLDRTEKLLKPLDFELVGESILKRHDDSEVIEERRMRERERKFLRRLVTGWAPDLTPIVNLLDPDTGRLFIHLQRQRAQTLSRELWAMARDRLAIQMLDSLRSTGFVRQHFERRPDTRQAARVLLDADGPLWRGHRPEALRIFTEGKDNPGVQRNAFDLVYWFCSALRSRSNPGEAEYLKQLFAAADIREALWSAATAQPLASGKIVWIQDFPSRCGEMGARIVLPAWWETSLAESRVRTAPGTDEDPPAEGGTGEHA